MRHRVAALAVIAAAAACAASEDDIYGVLATRAPYPANAVDDVHRPGFNGRLFVTRPILGNQPGPFRADWPDPGPEWYGARGQERQLVYVRHGHVILALDPWTRVDFRPFEDARNLWLKRYGYVGGVRTFVNDRYLADTAQEYASGEPEPRAILRLRDRQRARLMVEAPVEPDASRVVAPPAPRPRFKVVRSAPPADTGLAAADTPAE